MVLPEEIVVNAVLAVIGSSIALLLAILAFFLIRLIAQLDTTTKTVDQLSLNFAVYLGQEKKHKEEIDTVKKRLSAISKRLISMKFQAENKGWKFNTDEWESGI